MVMDGMVKTRRCDSTTTPTSSSTITMHKDSHVISKFKPKIRIIHIFAPEIIKTDVENFRELVQRLTGKPSIEEKSCKKRARSMIKNHQAEVYCKPATIIEPQYGYQSSWMSCEDSIIKSKEEQDVMWGGDHHNNSSGFYNGFGDLDGFIQGLNEFPLLPFTTSSASSQTQMDMFGETCLSQ
ncbi:Vq motif-containing protein [Thalictrum thalictroides]|uniref:Vq motif-containing protein n=1 Tax=Thalictrum thalictroides TaxID=46969 RepID=A0A7J6VU79_THATH|nr:Vq motif-containing protein [Thalictrum thalictroides]